MAEQKKYKLGELEFDTEQEYRDAALDLKRIKELMAKYDITSPEQAGKILTTIKAHPEAFRSPYGRKFVEKLEKAASRPAAPVPSKETETKQADGRKPQEQGGRRNGRKTDGSGTQKEKFQIFTIRNFVIGIIIIAGIAAFSLFAPKLFQMNNGMDSNGDIKRNMVTAYAKNQASLKADLYTYYFNVVGETEDEAKKDAQAGIDHYVLDLSDRTISRMTESEVKDVFEQLVEGGDIQNNSFVEPPEISVLKDKLLAAGLANNTSNGTEGETSVTAAVNSMMDYQERIFYSLCYDYSLLSYQPKDCEEFAIEDMTAMFGEGHIIYDFNMTEEEKQSYYDSFIKKGLIKDNQVVRFSTDPAAYNLPDLTPVIEVSLKGEPAKAYRCSMVSYAPAASVFYEIHSDDASGYICLRNNGDNTKYIQLDDDTSVTAQGDFFMISGSDFYTGEWFYNRQNVGLFMNGDQSSFISYVHELTY